MTSLYDEIRELQGEVQRLQKALAFWLPSVPVNSPKEFLDRIANDAQLLVGHEPEEDESDAETQGWIRLQVPQQGSQDG